MLKNLIGLLIVGGLITACVGFNMPAVPTITPIPTPSINYQVVGGTKNVTLIVVEPADRMDRAGLQSIVNFLCPYLYFNLCTIYFWDDINQAPTTYPFSEEQKAALIAMYMYDFNAQAGTLTVYTLGDK